MISKFLKGTHIFWSCFQNNAIMPIKVSNYCEEEDISVFDEVKHIPSGKVSTRSSEKLDRHLLERQNTLVGTVFFCPIFPSTWTCHLTTLDKLHDQRLN
jgi:hypothetical protein